MRRYILGSKQFERRKLAEFKDSGIDPVLVRALNSEVKASDDKSARAFDFTISTDAVDRYGDTIAVDGWKLENYRKNPVVLWMHNNRQLTVAKASNIRIEDGRLKARATFDDEGQDEFNDKVYRQLTVGLLSATSVGFIPLKYAFVDEPDRRFGIDFLEQELLEFSIVTVPANPEALLEGKDMAVTSSETQILPVESSYSLNLAQHRVRALKLRAA